MFTRGWRLLGTVAGFYFWLMMLFMGAVVLFAVVLGVFIFWKFFLLLLVGAVVLFALGLKKDRERAAIVRDRHYAKYGREPRPYM